MALPIECHESLGEYFVAFRAWEAITNLLNYYKNKIDASNWYTLALCDEYATIARGQIMKFELKQVPLLAEYFSQWRWQHLTMCEQKTIKYQSVINHLGNNLQCVASAAIVTTTFFINQTPVVNDQIGHLLDEWILDYNYYQKKDLIFNELNKQPGCANRMLNNPENFFSQETKRRISSIRTVDGKPPRSDRTATAHELAEYGKEIDFMVKGYLNPKRQVSILFL